MISALPQSQDNFGMLGHVEYKLFDEFGSIKQYMQNDNLVVNVGKDCVARMVFDNATADPINCINNNTFQFIAIGNATGGTIDEDSTTLYDGVCASTGVGGEMARKQVTPSFVAATGTGPGVGAIVTLDLSSDPFTFGSSNSTIVIDSGVFNAQTGQDAEKQCQGPLTGTEMFSIQEINDQNGISVSDGDSLSVKWTITVG
jgi:hypothetical protein